MIAALYICPAGPYPRLLGQRYCWDESRDARKYAGPYPVIAHPPCGPWSKLRHLCTKQDATCGPRAVEQVQSFGGVLEHPEHSLLFNECGLPKPGELPDAFGGRAYLVRQVWWGHQCDKPTWLYVVGGIDALIRSDIEQYAKLGRTATHCVCTGPRQKQRLPVATKKSKRLTPPEFALWLISLAEQAQMRRTA